MAWERLAHVELSSSGDTLDSGTFTAKKSLRVIVYIIPSGNTRTTFRFNSDSGSNYAHRNSFNGGSDSTKTSRSSIEAGDQDNDHNAYHVLEITNIADKEKIIINHNLKSGGSGASNAPSRKEDVAKWANTSNQITSIQAINDQGGSYGVGSYITVLGAKEPATADSITVSSFTAKKNLKAQLFASGTGGTINCNFTFNNDTGSNYAIRESVNGGSDSTNVSQANTDNLTGTVTGSIFADVNITNESSKEKLFISEGLESTSGAGTAPDRKEMVGKWANTSAQITTIKANNGGTGSYSEGSELIVWGSDGSADITLSGALTNIVGGFIFEEKNTGKHYIWNATTSTWTEIA